MKKHNARVRQTMRHYFKKPKSRSEASVRTLFRDSLHYMNIFGDQAPTMYLCGNQSLYIEHYESILEYTGARVKLKLPKMQLILEGRDICLEYFSQNDVKIRGKIGKITFEEPEVQKTDEPL